MAKTISNRKSCRFAANRKPSSKKLKRPVYSLVVEDLEKGVGGRCSYSTKRIIIDINEFSKVSNRFYLISIIFHEGRQAYQRDEIDEKQNLTNTQIIRLASGKEFSIL